MQIYLTYFLLISSYYVKAWEFLGYKLPQFPTKFLSNPLCLVQECCNEDYIKFKPARLKQNLTSYVYGQPLLQDAVDALSGHFNPHYKSTKALTLSFHGMTGTGKNYVANFIADSIFAKGSKSKYVHHFIGRMHFSEKQLVNQYKVNLYNWLKGNVSECKRQLFIFDEVDKMVPEVLNSIKPMLDHRDDVDGVDYSQSIFIFLSNTGADVIREHYYQLYIKEGKNRDELHLSDFETYIQNGAFNEEGWFEGYEQIIKSVTSKVLKVPILGLVSRVLLNIGGFQYSDTIRNNLIDHYIPFLPLEEKHIIQCIKKEFNLRHVLFPKQEHIEQVMKFIEWGPDETKMFSKTGCKRLAPKVAVVVDKHYRHVWADDHEEL